jgi:hypothetical protein
MALDAVEAARDQLFVDEFDRRARLLPFTAEMGYIDRIRVLDELIDSKVIGLNERRLRLGQIDGVEWITAGLACGNEITWAIAEAVDRHERVVRKFESDLLAEIGQVGELAVLARLRECLFDSRRSQIEHVSLLDDTLGYDIVAPFLKSDESFSLLEVKTSSRPGKKFNLYISRNEYRVGLNNPNWFLVCVQIVRDTPQILGHLRLSQIADRFPADQSESVMWASCRVTLSQDILLEGLP